jgi:hypothetical protein
MEKWNLEKHITMFSNYNFTPVINIFDKSIVITYPKVGSRFFLFLSNYPKSLNDVYNQYQLNIHYGYDVNPKLNLNTKLLQLTTSIDFIDEHKNSCYDYETFFSKNAVDNMYQFIFENEKDIYFVIRNPLDRFLSGIIQVVALYIHEMITEECERTLIKSLCDISDTEIDEIYKNYDLYFNEYDEFNKNDIDNINIDIFLKILIYIINHKQHLYYYDVHTQNYLFRYNELICNIDNKNKIKIIDLYDCKKQSAYELFNNWSDTIDYKPAFHQTKGHIISNKKLYNHIVSILNNDSVISQNFYIYLANEIRQYNELKKSKYYINI